MNLFEKILNDKEIIDRYYEIEKYEELNKGWAYHNISHVLNVTIMVEKILSYLKYNRKFIECAKIAAILHDTGANEGKEGHAYRSYIFAKNYLLRKQINLQYENEVLEAIKIHSDGFDTDNMIALAIILADKLDVKSNRITKEGEKIIGNRQYKYVRDIDIKIENKKMLINFLVDYNFDIAESEQYYFTEKIFKAIKAFCRKFELQPIVMVNNKNWRNFNNN